MTEKIQKDYVLDFIKEKFDEIGNVTHVCVEITTESCDDDVSDLQNHALTLVVEKKHI